MTKCVLAAIFLGVTIQAQDYRAKVQGVVTDSTEAAIAGARVVLRSLDTGVQTYRDTNQAGVYLFDHVEPGTYTVAAEMQGFSRQTRENVLVQTRQDVTVNFSLKPGSLVETVTVTASAVSLQFNSSTMELTVDRKMLMDLPVKARNPFTLALLNPAVVNRYPAERNPFFMWSSSSIDVGGNTTRRNDLLIDGAPAQIGPKGSYAPPMDAVQEFSVQQNSVDAEFGHSAGGILSLGMKSGTNEIHGTAYYFGRNPALNAVVNPITRTPNFIRNHIWGATAGAPIRENKLFTFMAYEQWRTNEPRDAIRTQPTDLERTGDFSRSLNRSGGQRTIFDPWTSRLNVASNTASRDPFPGNVIPASRIDPTARRIMQDIWGPNGPGDDLAGSNNFKISYAWPMTNLNLSNRTDWVINDRWKVFGRYSQFWTTLDQENFTPNNSRAMRNDNGGIMNSRNYAGDAVWTASARTVFNFRASYASLADNYYAPEYEVGENGLAEFWPGNPWYKPYLKDVPQIYYPGLNIGGATFGRGSYWIQEPRHWAGSAKMSRTQGNHYWKVGGEHRYHIGDGVYPNLMNFNFFADDTASSYLQPLTQIQGDAYASFLLGVLDPRSNANLVSSQSIHIPFFALYVHDDWKVSRRVTLNLGLRYEWSSGPFDARDRFSRYLDLTDPIPEMQRNPPVIPADILAIRTQPPVFNGAWIFADSQNRKQFVTERDVFLPRAGAAIRVNDKTVLNIGFARYVVPISTIGRSLDRLTFPGFNATSLPLSKQQGVPQANFADPFPPGRNPLQAAPGKGFGRYTELGNAASWINQDYRAQINDRVNVTIMRELPGQIRADATYFLNFGRYVHRNRQVNMADPMLGYTYKAQLSQNIPNPFFNYGTPETFPGALRNQPMITRGALLRPYPQYGALTEEGQADFRNYYQALQLRLQRTYSAGASFLAAYNYNRERSSAFFNDIEEYAVNPFWLASNNARHRLTLAGVYDFPVGKGRKLMPSAHPVIDGILGGWQVSGIYTFRSGEFLRFPAAEVVGDPFDIESRGPNAWFNTAAFRVQPAFTPRMNPWQYEGLTGPTFWNLDATVSKFFPITERMKLEFRMEGYNVTNSLMWANPTMVVANALFGRSTAQAAGNRGREFQYTMRLLF